MRTTDEFAAVREIPPLPEDRVDPERLVRSAIRGSPWVVIALAAHLLFFGALSVTYAQRCGRPEVTTTSAIFVSTVQPRDPIDEPPPEVFFGSGAIPKETGESESVEFLDPDVPDVASPPAVGDQGPIPPQLDPSSAAPFPWPLYVTPLPRLMSGAEAASAPAADSNPRSDEGVRSSVLAALEWLSRHQSPDGHWDGDVGVTGLSLLAFLGAGYTHQSRSPFQENVRRGLRWLRDQQDAEGCFGRRASSDFLLDHARATLAMAEAYRRTGSRLPMVLAENGIAFLDRERGASALVGRPSPGEDKRTVAEWTSDLLQRSGIEGMAASPSSLLASQCGDRGAEHFGSWDPAGTGSRACATAIGCLRLGGVLKPRLDAK